MNYLLPSYLVRKRLQMPPPILEGELPAEVPEEATTEKKPTELEQRMQTRHTHQQEQHEQVHLLHQQGMSIHAIARHLSLARNTVRRHLRMGEQLQVAPRPKKSSILDPDSD